MSVVVVQLGQCGNQVGRSVFDFCARQAKAAKDEAFTGRTLERLFDIGGRGLPRARAVMVDMEPKAISRTRELAKGSGLWGYAASHVVAGHAGSGNNWAMGFHHYGPRVAASCTDQIRRQLEACDAVDGMLLLQSVAGGTGSGLGARAPRRRLARCGLTHASVQARTSRRRWRRSSRTPRA